MKYFAFLLFLLVSMSVFGQSDDAFTHRAVLMDADGKPFSMSTYRAEVNILEDPESTDNVSFAETHSIKTDSLGWYSIKIGSGEVVSSNKKFSDIDWSSGRKFLNVKVFDSVGAPVANGITEILASPQISFAKSIESRALLTLDCLPNLDALRNFPIPEDGDVICVKGHTFSRDGGEGFFYYKKEVLANDDDGIIIKPIGIGNSKPGRWIRNIDGPINILYYGVRPGRRTGVDSNSKRIQAAIDYAASNKAYDHARRYGDVLTQGNTVFFPSGEYMIDKTLIMKDGIKLLGEGHTLLTAEKYANFDYFFKMEAGRVIIHMENLRINGNGEAGVGGMHFKAKDGPNGTGGLWQSRFENINIVNIEGHGIFLEGGDSMGIEGENDWSLPNQMNVFENVRVTRENDDKNSLRMTKYQGQHTFINCIFVGKRDRSSQGSNVHLTSPGGAVVSFINCTFGDSIYGITMDNSSNITIDNCWFENLYFSIDVFNSKSINIFNNRFSNACGYGSELYTVPSRVPSIPGSCISCENSVVSIERNYVRASRPASEEAHSSNFITGYLSQESGINENTIFTKANTFDHPGLSKTVGIVRQIPVSARTILLDGGNEVAAGFGGSRVLRRIESTVLGGEEIILRIDKPRGNGKVKIMDWQGKSGKGNIDLKGRKFVELTHGQKAIFLKVDPPLSNNEGNPIYVLLGVTDST